MNRKILALAIPNIISNITIPLLGMVDMAIVGHLGDDALIGGNGVHLRIEKNTVQTLVLVIQVLAVSIQTV